MANGNWVRGWIERYCNEHIEEKKEEFEKIRESKDKYLIGKNRGYIRALEDLLSLLVVTDFDSEIDLIQERCMRDIIEENCLDCEEFRKNLNESECICEPLVEVFERCDEFNIDCNDNDDWMFLTGSLFEQERNKILKELGEVDDSKC